MQRTAAVAQQACMLLSIASASPADVREMGGPSPTNERYAINETRVALHCVTTWTKTSNNRRLTAGGNGVLPIETEQERAGCRTDRRTERVETHQSVGWSSVLPTHAGKGKDWSGRERVSRSMRTGGGRTTHGIWCFSGICLSLSFLRSSSSFQDGKVGK